MALYGVETWTRRGEAFSVYFNLLSRLSIFEKRGHEVGVRPPLGGLPPLERPPGTVAVRGGDDRDRHVRRAEPGRDLEGHLHQPVRHARLDAAPTRSACCSGVGLVGGFYLLGMAGAQTVGGGFDTRTLARAFVHSLVPIAARLRRRALPHVPHLRGPGDPLHGLGPVRTGLGPVRLGQTPGSTTACCRRTRPGTSRSGWSSPATSPRSCWRTTARSRSTVRPGWRCSPNSGCWRS